MNTIKLLIYLLLLLSVILEPIIFFYLSRVLNEILNKANGTHGFWFQLDIFLKLYESWSFGKMGRRLKYIKIERS